MGPGHVGPGIRSTGPVGSGPSVRESGWPGQFLQPTDRVASAAVSDEDFPASIDGTLDEEAYPPNLLATALRLRGHGRVPDSDAHRRAPLDSVGKWHQE